LVLFVHSPEVFVVEAFALAGAVSLKKLIYIKILVVVVGPVEMWIS
jgi:hypothetical protein